MTNRIFLGVLLLIIPILTAHSQFISNVIEYKPAPGQFINKTPWGTPASKESLVGGVQGSMSLGAFGGYVVFRFAEPVKNHPDNPYGIDFTIFGNPLATGGRVTWSEPASVWVMKDVNGNGLPDDTWYELAGSDYWFSSTIKNYEVTYTNPGGTVAADVPWTDNQGNSGSVLANAFHSQPYYPQSNVFDNINSHSYTLSGTLIEGALDMRVATYIMSYARGFGYVDNHLRGSAPWTVPNNPYSSQTEGSGGDAFDISWAVDANGNYVDLDEIHFVKVVGAMQRNAGWLGEVSTEITGAVVVTPNTSITGVQDMIVIKELPYTIETPTMPLEAFAFHKGRIQRDWIINWSSNIPEASVDENNVLHLENYKGKLELTASLNHNPAITATVSADVNVTTSSTGIVEFIKPAIYPNPATNNIRIGNINSGHIEIYNMAGSLIKYKANYNSSNIININEFANGVYVVVIKSGNNKTTLKLIKN